MRLKIREELYGWLEIRTQVASPREMQGALSMEVGGDNRIKNRNIDEESHHPIRSRVTTDAA